MEWSAGGAWAVPRASVGETRAGLEEKVPAVPAGLGGSALVPTTVDF